MTNKDIIDLYKKGYSVSAIAKQYHRYIIKYDKFFHSVEYNFCGKKKYYYVDSLVYVQDLLLKYLSGYFE